MLSAAKLTASMCSVCHNSRSPVGIDTPLTEELAGPEQRVAVALADRLGHPLEVADLLRHHGRSSASSRTLSRARSLVVARRIARSMTGAAMREKPDGFPRLRRVILVDPCPAGSQA